MNESSIWSFDQYSTLWNITLKSAEFDEYHYYVATDAAAAAVAVKFDFTNATFNLIFFPTFSRIFHIRNVVALHIHVKSFIVSSAFHRHFSSSFHWLKNFGKCTTKMNTKIKNAHTNMRNQNYRILNSVKFLSQVAFYLFFFFLVILSSCLKTFENRKLYLHIEMVQSGWECDA